MPRSVNVCPRNRVRYTSFTIDSFTGRLTATGWVPTEPVPRAFSLDPEGSFLVVAGLNSGRLASYQVHQDSGVLTPLETYEGGNRPMWVIITKLTGQENRAS